MLIGSIVALALAASAPDPREAAVTATVQRFFDALAREDRATIAEVVAPESRFTAVRVPAQGAAAARHLTVEDFSKNLRPGLNERMWSPEVRVRGDTLAMVWAPYEFQLDGKTTHCGIDVFTLVKTDGAWRITSLAWTQEPTACAELKR